MGIKERLVKMLGGEIRTLSSDVNGMREIFGYTPSKSGIEVTEESAMRLTAVYACVRILSESIASLPLKIYKRAPDGKKEAISHPLYRILHDISNDYQSSFEIRETVVTHLNLWGNAYLLKKAA